MNIQRYDRLRLLPHRPRTEYKEGSPQFCNDMKTVFKHVYINLKYSLLCPWGESHGDIVFFYSGCSPAVKHARHINPLLVGHVFIH